MLQQFSANLTHLELQFVSSGTACKPLHKVKSDAADGLYI